MDRAITTLTHFWRTLSQTAQRWVLSGRASFVDAVYITTKNPTDRQIERYLDKRHGLLRASLLREKPGIGKSLHGFDELVGELVHMANHIVTSFVSGLLTLTQARYASACHMSVHELVRFICEPTAFSLPDTADEGSHVRYALVSLQRSGIIDGAQAEALRSQGTPLYALRVYAANLFASQTSSARTSSE